MKNKKWFKKHTKLKIILIILGILVLIVLFLPNQDNRIKQKTEESSTIEVSKNIEGNFFTVNEIIDGDTFYIEGKNKIRLICVNTPEINEKGYQEAKEYLQNLILYKNVNLTKDISETDIYNRLLRYAYTEDGIFINELIVKNGYGKAYPYSPDNLLCPQIERAESYAKSNKLGIWAKT